MGTLSLAVAVAQPAVVVILGEAWAPSAGLLRILAFGSVFQCMGYIYYWSFLAAGRPAQLLLAELPGRTLIVTGVLAAWPFGVSSVAWVVSIGQFVVFVTVALTARGSLAFGLEQLLAPTALPFAVFGFAAALSLAVEPYALIAGSLQALAIQTTVWVAAVVVMYIAVPQFHRAVNLSASIAFNREKAHV